MDANIHEIYHLLMDGKELKLNFREKEDAERFRVKLAQFKSAQDKMMIGVGLIETGELRRFSFSVQGDLELGWTASMKFTDRIVEKTYSIVIVTDESEVSGNLGTD